MSLQSSNLNIAYISSGDAKSIHTWSGTVFFLAEALKKNGLNLYYFDNINNKKNVITYLYNKIFSIFNKIINKKYHNDRTIKNAKMAAIEIEKKLSDYDFIDVIFIPSGTLQMAFLRTNKKKIIYNDATFNSMIDYYNGFTNLCSKTLKEGHIIEKNAFENADLLLFSSDWAANSAINDYNINPLKVKVIPIGANIEEEPTDNDIAEIIEKRCNSRCNLLFIGIDWERKGGKIALEITKELYFKNINVHLDIVGIDDASMNFPKYVTNHGFIDKNTEDGKNKIINLYKNAQFFLLPTRQECFGIVFSEASAYGLPSISTKTGGVETAIKDNINGMTFDISDPPIKYSDYIEKLINNQNEYKKLCFSAYNYYRKNLNWNVVGKQIVNLINEIHEFKNVIT